MNLGLNRTKVTLTPYSKNYPKLFKTLVQLGYTFRHDFFDRKFFAKGPANCRTYYLHLVVYKGPQWLKMLKFRETLNSNPNLANQPV